MKFIADLHVHSPFSRATSKKSDLFGLSDWANLKGIQLLGTGDFTHPGWFKQLKENLEPSDLGVFYLKNEVSSSRIQIGESSNDSPVAFMLSSEISCVYKKEGKTRRIHCLVYIPDFESAEKFSTKLAAIGNIESDGRPILGLDAKNLLEMLLESAPDSYLIPAHIWTPWYSLFGSKSGFDSIEECFEDLSTHIFALETGLSSDPSMNRMISALDNCTLVSNSDCHSPANLGREANIFNTEMDFWSIKEAIKNPEKGFNGTIEFFPEEGKYHHDGHRNCGISLTPKETIESGSICPRCGKPITIGVLHRVMELADRDSPNFVDGISTFPKLISLPEILSELHGVGSKTKTVMKEYQELIAEFGNEFNLLLNVPINEIEIRYSNTLAAAISRVRNDKVKIEPGFDGQYGKICIFSEEEIKRLRENKDL